MALNLVLGPFPGQHCVSSLLLMWTAFYPDIYARHKPLVKSACRGLRCSFMHSKEMMHVTGRICILMMNRIPLPPSLVRFRYYMFEYRRGSATLPFLTAVLLTAVPLAGTLAGFAALPAFAGPDFAALGGTSTSLKACASQYMYYSILYYSSIVIMLTVLCSAPYHP